MTIVYIYWLVRAWKAVWNISQSVHFILSSRGGQTCYRNKFDVDAVFSLCIRTASAIHRRVLLGSL